MKKYLFLLGFVSLFASCAHPSFFNTNEEKTIARLQDELKAEKEKNASLQIDVLSLQEKATRVTIDCTNHLNQATRQLRECSERSSRMVQQANAALQDAAMMLSYSSSRTSRFRPTSMSSYYPNTSLGEGVGEGGPHRADGKLYKYDPTRVIPNMSDTSKKVIQRPYVYDSSRAW